MEFKVGEVVIIQSVEAPQFNGMETEIIKPRMRKKGQAYKCTVANIAEGCDGWYETALRKLPDGRTKTEWSGVFVPRELVV